ncbi:hypothetical protein GN244_ATG11982 [Phytophthora infestans]|uniref:Uncharacterized protein n=1 Tax=Phytophthora infestans TaxID=4787 RepID=A0A833SZA9_PHYIN|nr:hypothetical protein GN244_ATG11982 [Phytophthora infestans]
MPTRGRTQRPSDPRRQCGRGIHVFVTFSEDVSAAPLDDLVLCTRFESAIDTCNEQQVDARLAEDKGGHVFRTGEIVILPDNVLEGGGGDAAWSRARRVSDANMQHLSMNFSESLRANNCVTRLQQGRLVATIFLLRGVPHNHTNKTWQTHADILGRTAELLWRQVSPNFSLDCCIEHCNNSGTKSVTPLSHIRPQEAGTRRIPRRSEDVQCPTNAFAVADADSSYDKISTGAGAWQQTTFANRMEFRVKSQHLLILWKFFTGIKLRDVIFSANTISMYLSARLQQAESASRSQSSSQVEDIAALFFQDIFGHTFNPPPCATSSFYMGHAFQSTTIRVTVHLFLRVMSSRAVVKLLHAALQAGRDATSKQKLQELFISLVVDVYDALSVIFSEVVPTSDLDVEAGPSMSLATLVDDAISLLYGHKRFAGLQPEILGLFKCQQDPQLLTDAVNEVFHFFTAQVRETIIASETKQSCIVQSLRPVGCNTTRSSQNLLQSGHKLRWLLEPGSVQVRDVSGRDVLGDIRIAEVAQFVREFGCFDAEIGQSNETLSMVSVFSFSNDTLVSPMKLVLDGRLRVFRVLPTGVSSMIATVGGWSIGDYMGSLEHDKQEVDVDFFAYREVSTRPRVRGQLAGDGETMLRRISLEFSFENIQDSSTTFLDEAYYPSNVCAHVNVMVFGSTYMQPGAQKLCEATSAERGNIWRSIEWKPLMKIRADISGFDC